MQVLFIILVLTTSVLYWRLRHARQLAQHHEERAERWYQYWELEHQELHGLFREALRHDMPE